MHKLLPLALAAVLLPVGLVAQKAPPVRNAPAQVMDARDRITLQDAQGRALARARQEVAKACCDKLNAGKLSVVYGALTTVNGQEVYMVAVGTAGVPSHLRLLLDPKSGAVKDVALGAFSWGMAPAYWQQGLSAPPPARSK